MNMAWKPSLPPSLLWLWLPTKNDRPMLPYQIPAVKCGTPR
jgi:hypothetical protein